MVAGQDLAVEDGVVGGGSGSCDGATDLHRLGKCHVPLLEWMRVGAACEHSEGRHGVKFLRRVTIPLSSWGVNKRLSDVVA
jgi:hypothetical protein